MIAAAVSLHHELGTLAILAAFIIACAVTHRLGPRR
jgi:hypothetical protein